MTYIVNYYYCGAYHIEEFNEHEFEYVFDGGAKLRRPSEGYMIVGV